MTLITFTKGRRHGVTQQIIALVPSKDKKFLVWNGEKSIEFSSPADIVKGFEILAGQEKKVQEWLGGLDEKKQKTVQKRLQFFQELAGKDVVLCGIMGGLGQALFLRAADLKLNVARIPMYRLQDATGIQPKSNAEDYATAVAKARREHEDFFYPISSVNPRLALVRELTRERLGIQDLRKPMQLRLYAALREVRYVLPSEAERTIELIEQSAKKLFENRSLGKQIEEALRRLEELLPKDEGQRILGVIKHYANPRFILGAKEDEESLESGITKQLERLPIWEVLHRNSASALPPLKGLGPAIGGSIVSETADIRRFPSSKDYRSYARFGLVDGKFPRRQAGVEFSINVYLNRAVWLWSTDQVARYDHPWKALYMWQKAVECQRHPDVVPREVIDKKGRKRTIYDYSLKHLDSRAKRWVGSQLLTYIYELWTKLENGVDVEDWYRATTWPSFFQQAEGELSNGLGTFLEEEIKRRKRMEPEEEELEEDEGL